MEVACTECGARQIATKDTRFCHGCGAKLNLDNAIEATDTADDRISGLWWLAAVFLGIPGGIAAYLANRRRNETQARAMLVTSAWVTAAMLLLIVLYVITILTSLSHPL